MQSRTASKKTYVVAAVALLTIGAAAILPLSLQQKSLGQSESVPADETGKHSGLGEPFFVEKGKIIGQRVLDTGSEPQLEFTMLAFGTLNGDIPIRNTATMVSTLKGNGSFHSTGQGVIMTQDGEIATYVNQVSGTISKDGKIMFRGSGLFSTESDGKLAFLDNMLTVFTAEVDEEGNLTSEEWEWK